jgi:pimeloyl-ACP methyl ester carboxylesterase
MVIDESRDTLGSDVRVMTDDGVLLAVQDCGAQKAQRTVVFLHGLCLTRASWAAQVAYLSRRYGSSVRLISYDHRGHGRSGPAPISTYRIDRLAEDLAQVLAAAKVSGQVTLVGHSMGGMAALAYLGQSGLSAKPIEPQGLVLVATTAGKLAERGLGRLLATPLTAALPELAALSSDRVVRALVGPASATLARWRYGTHSATLAEVAVTALATNPMTTAVGFLPSLRAHAQHAALAGIRARTVILSGGRDPLIPSAHARELAAGIRGALHVHLPQAGHMLPQQAPCALNAAICRAMTSEVCQDGWDEAQGPAPEEEAVPA